MTTPEQSLSAVLSSKSAVLFDMDDVVVGSEKNLTEAEKRFFSKLWTADSMYRLVSGNNFFGNDMAMLHYVVYADEWQGEVLTSAEFQRRYFEAAVQAYTESLLTPLIGELFALLQQLGFKIGLVTQSYLYWVEQVQQKFELEGIENPFDTIVSLGQSIGTPRQILLPKPAPDGYREVMRRLQVTPAETIVIEDSQSGVSAAKEAEAYTICLRQWLEPDTQPVGADLYLDTLQPLIDALQKIARENMREE
ncbi:MAG: hypothetical protein A3A82_00800 [Candidatus Pacebacteria bacterium RIFCSPLOWO2_01_FULL_47_12]|nr:MAG: hypothetical protein A3J60_02870 [Candidatus Pacebacteria bacterium RIFCSPHIGHO2_02_FULL_46_9]OGJ37986.1 MAG: hypothetical protein A3A82_00800 [Candidatus Pacebacteria bacterium RIFCSPLOWO2_01_FULL_47_12]